MVRREWVPQVPKVFFFLPRFWTRGVGSCAERETASLIVDTYGVMIIIMGGGTWVCIGRLWLWRRRTTRVMMPTTFGVLLSGYEDLVFPDGGFFFSLFRKWTQHAWCGRWEGEVVRRAVIDTKCLLPPPVIINTYLHSSGRSRNGRDKKSFLGTIIIVIVINTRTHTGERRLEGRHGLRAGRLNSLCEFSHLRQTRRKSHATSRIAARKQTKGRRVTEWLNGWLR
ncbi:hypothetical protein K504DRAFT_126778 [Pleomassaria siparia CBS 279.74]|uniref:Transmembrane protein n=1 Tax=Pleomassaria siparia CBS 279.74 TaxID=1314801 RepID=A0A6G1KKQ4_9PLEO|nr:hypothetical protein K504DRAFT_126778 [Pleomassaria siparia CBS 279.74]